MDALDHGYCRSVYVVDPNGLILEFTRDHPNAAAINRTRLSTAITIWRGGWPAITAPITSTAGPSQAQESDQDKLF